MNPTLPNRSVEEIVRNWLEEEKKDNYVDIHDLNDVTLDGSFSLLLLIEALTAHDAQKEGEAAKVVEELDACIQSCEDQNGLPYCKNCGLERSMYESLSDAQKRITEKEV